MSHKSAEQIEALAQRAHASMNSGVGAASSPLSWKSESAVMRDWWVRLTDSVLDAIEYCPACDGPCRDEST